MSKTARVVNLLAVVLPPILISICIVLFWDEVVGISDLVVLFAMYLITGYGVTVGFHRMLTHRSFGTPKPVEYLFAAAGSMAVQGPVINWVADHRKHHAHTDEEGDPHSPHVGRQGRARRTARPAARARRVARVRPRPSRPRALRARPRRGPGDAAHQPLVPRPRRARARASRRDRVARHRPAQRRADRAPVG